MRKLWFLSSLILVFLLSGVAFAQGPEPQGVNPVWSVSYWNNVSLSGEPVVQVSESKIDWNWGTGAPYPALGADQFSGRWTGWIYASEQRLYRFTTTSDDGVRVYIDNNKVVDAWYDHAAQTFVGDLALTAGHHIVVVEYYERTGAALLRFTWEPAPIPFAAWSGAYYANRFLTGAPALNRDDPNILFDWGTGSPASTIPADDFSVRWTRTVRFNAGRYRFTVGADDGVRLWVNNYLLIDGWRDQSFATYEAEAYVEGDVPLKVEYYERSGLAAVRVSWAAVGGGTPGNEIVIDDTHAGFVTGGAAASWRTVSSGYGGRMLWTLNNDRVRDNYNWARWYPNLEPGRYEVFAYIPTSHATTTSARYWVAHNDGINLNQVNQSASGGGWVSLGTYRFRGGQSDYVSLADVTYEPYLSREIAFDAVKWVPR